MKKVIVFASVALLLAAILAFIKVPYQQIVVEGTDTFATHSILSGDRVAMTSLDATKELAAVGFLVVPLTGDNHIPANIKISGHNEVVEELIEPQKIKDDTYYWINTLGVFGDEFLEIVLSSPDATSQNALGVRFDEDTGQLALAIEQRVAVYRRALLWSVDNPEESSSLVRVISHALLLFGLFAVFDRFEKKWKYLPMLGLVSLVVISVGVRLKYVGSVDSFFGGDAMNYYLKGVAWLDGGDPFSTDARKGPFWTLLLLPGLLPGLDPLTWGRLLNIGFASAASVLVALILRQFKLSWAVSLAGGLLLAVNRHWIFESIHTLANPSFAFLFLLTAYFFLQKKLYALGVTAALATLNRYEGFLSFWLMQVSWFSNISWRKKATSIIPAAALLSIPFLAWPFTGKIGVRTAGDIAADGGLSVAWSPLDFFHNLERFRTYIGRQWILQDLVGDQWTVLAAGVVIGLVLAFAAKKYKYFKKIYAVPAIIMILALPLLVSKNSLESWRLLSMNLTLLAGFGLGRLLFQWPKQVTPIIVLLIAHSVAIVSILPKDRYWLPLIPFIIIFMVFGLSTSKKWSKLTLAATSLFIAFVFVTDERHIVAAIGDYNTKSASQTVMLNASRYLSDKPGTVFPAKEDLSMRIYIGDDRIFEGELGMDEVNQDYIIDNGAPRDIPHYQVAQTWRVEDEDATVYRKMR